MTRRGARLSTWLVVALAALVLSLTRSARAERGIVVLDTAADPASAEVRDRTEDELRVAGFTVLSAAGTADGDPRRLAEELGAIAIVTVTRVEDAPAEARWVISVADRVTGKRSERRVAEAAPGALDAPRIALLAVELLYASLLELEATTPERGPVAAPPAVSRAVRRRLVAPSTPPRWAVRAGAGLATAPGGLGTPASGVVGFAAWPRSFVGVDAVGALTLTPITVDDGGTSARLTLATARASGVAVLWPQRLVSLSGGLGGGVLLARARGSALAPLEGTNETTSVGLVTATGGVAWRLRRHLRLRLDAAGSLAIPEVDVRFAGRSVATAGRPLFEAAATAEWVLR